MKRQYIVPVTVALSVAPTNLLSGSASSLSLFSSDGADDTEEIESEEDFL